MLKSLFAPLLILFVLVGTLFGLEYNIAFVASMEIFVQAALIFSIIIGAVVFLYGCF